MTNYGKKLYGNSTPQTEKQFNKDQVKNNAGGYVYVADKWTVLNRFIIIGTENNSFYASSNKMTVEHAQNILELIKEDGKRVVNTVIEISNAGRAPKNDAAIFTLAMCASFGDNDTRKYAFDNMSKVARIGTHLFQFIADVNNMRGWGRGFRTAVANWYTEKTTDTLAYQVMKYKNREGWTHKDAIKLSHPKPKNDEQNFIFNTIVKGFDEVEDSDFMTKYKIGMNFASIVEDNVDKAVELIKQYNLPREVIPTTMLKDRNIWMALLEANMPLTAMLRNIGNMTKCGLLTPFSEAEKIIISTITNQEHIHKSRIHPLSVLVALKTYNQGHGIRGNGEWDVNPRISNALDDMFDLSFDNVESTGLRYLNSIDISGSMTSGISSHPYITSLEAMACMSMCLVKKEENVLTGVFDTSYSMVNIGKNDRLTTVANMFDRYKYHMGGTDCAQPIKYALKKNIPIDVFFVGSDGETWAGERHVDQVLDEYRQKTGIGARLVVANTAANYWSLSNKVTDPLSLDLAGFDSAWLQIMHEFVTGKI